MLDTGTYLSKNTAVLQSAKNAIQEWCADKKRRLPPPVYKTISEEGPDHKKTYTRACEINGVVMGVGIGKNCKIADAAAAEAALEKLKAQESESKEVSAPMRDGASKLRSFCAKNKLGAPIFTDLGEQEGSDDYAKMYEFECVVKDVKITKSARSKSEARSAAAEEMLKLLEAK
jgi:dsRNA-specific ribonuclease